MTETKEVPEAQIFKTVLTYCLFIIALPIISFFTSKTLIFNSLLGVNSISSNVYAAGVAIIVLHVALGAFIYRTYFDSQTKSPAKTD
ncbi:vacuolar ATPase assembly integral membrane protein VMA21 homolog [Leptopilina heterotoma]|uniref:vacuolar ATPase assembly integral membrane protein VMA21 homolog n=1 Tax=Leptopilina heterotoma TaxID=63436 RepID=UPI001CA8D2DF|nr:vacuolar ATPase assembly integral membrane protein VMA21 homolog [Leptopilina heterotoma]